MATRTKKGKVRQSAKPGGRVGALRKKYGARAIDNIVRLNPHDFAELLEWRDRMDPHYTSLWLGFTYGGLFTRGILTDRVRLLVLIGQCVAQDELGPLGSHIRSALANGASPREVLEVILQVSVYVGYQKVARAARICQQVVARLGRMDEITRTQLPLDGRNSERTLERERPTWRVPDEAFPRREELMKKYGWQGISAGLRLQPTHHATTVDRLDRLDQNFLKLWLDFIYAGMYVRGVLDDKTRILCVVGVCIALDETVQGENHIRAALMLGASPREVLEVALQSTAYVGMPRCLRATAILERVLKEQGRMAELTETQPPLPSPQG
ncbi:MAG TPA: carboxymuconolactone decarboxylase family protein [Burkholderiales bacterium]|nr:carboxymuconolactone decarboxylase family protein [Burkholderiales bacterium]